MRRLPPTGSLEAFVAAARTGSLRKASEELNLSVSALSRRVQKLEEHAGKLLFSRTGNEYRLNDEGLKLFALIEAPLQDLMAALEPRSGSGKKELVVGVPTSFATAWLMPRLDSFRKSNPDIQLSLDTSGSPTEKLGDTLDLIIFFAEDNTGKLELQSLRPQGAFLVAGEGVVDPLYGLKACLRKTPLLVHRHLPRILECWKSELGLAEDMDLEIDSFDDGPLLIAAAQAGLGVALVLEDMVNFYGNSAGLVRPFGEYVETPFSYAIASKPATGSIHAIERFRRWIVEETRKDGQIWRPRKMLEAG